MKHYLMRKSREKKYHNFVTLTKPTRFDTLLDVGVSNNEYSPFDNFLEKRYPYRNMITALSIYSLENFTKRYPEIKAVTYMGGKFPFKDKQFSIVFSNAVIEHVGEEKEQVLFIKEIRRVGKQFYFSTPAKEFPIEMHTNYPLIHWFSDERFDQVITRLGKNWAAGNYMNLLRRKDIHKILNAANAREYNIITTRFGPFSLHYNVWGR